MSAAGPTPASGENQTAAQQLAYYKMVYSVVESSIDTAGVIKGVAFWRWAANTLPQSSLAAFDDYATIGSLLPPPLPLPPPPPSFLPFPSRAVPSDVQAAESLMASLATLLSSAAIRGCPCLLGHCL